MLRRLNVVDDENPDRIPRAPYQMRSIIVLLLLTYLCLFCTCASKFENTICYPEPWPDSVALPFLPGIVTSDSLDFALSFSPDGTTVYFCRSRKGKWTILESHFNGKSWSEPVTAAFSESQYSQADPFVAQDGSIYYISNRPRNDRDTIPDFDIWFVQPSGEGLWSDPVNLEAVNSDSTEYYVSIAFNGNIYFSSNRAGGYGNLDIYVSRIVNGKYTTPENLGASINSSTDEHDPLIIGTEQFLVYNSSQRADSYGEADLYFSSATPGGWSEPKNMGPLFNTATYEYCPNLSPDQRFFFFSSEYDIKWISSKMLPFRVTQQYLDVGPRERGKSLDWPPAHTPLSWFTDSLPGGAGRLFIYQM
jgi:hypothetical protein